MLVPFEITSRPVDECPVVFVVDDDEVALNRTGDELRRRYDRDYRIVCEQAADAALQTLERLRRDSEELALVLVDQWMAGVTGEEFLPQVKRLFPRAKRALLVDWGAWGDQATAEAILRSMGRGHMDYYVLKPWRSPDELFHRTISEFLHEWSRSEATGPREIAVIADRWSARGHELRTLLARNGVPYVFHTGESPEGQRLLAYAGRRSSDVPVVILFDGRVLADPSNAELATAYGVSTELGSDRNFDVVVVGAGPAGLAAGVYASSEGLRALVVEAESIGGQAGSSSLIRNYLGFSRGVSGSELAQRAYQQAWVFGTGFLLMRSVVGLRTEGDRHIVTISDGTEATARAVVLATGVSYRRLGVPSLEALVGAGVFYGSSAGEAQGLTDEDVYIVGGGNSAGQAAVHVSRYARHVTVVVRDASLSQTMSRYLADELEETANITVRLDTEVVDGGGEGRLEWLLLRNRTSGEVDRVPAAGLFILIGAHPRTEWLPPTISRDEWGFVLTGPDLGSGGPQRGMFETSLPGVFAVGDVRHRSVKRVASAVGEGSVVIQQVQRYLSEPEAPLERQPSSPLA